MANCTCCGATPKIMGQNDDNLQPNPDTYKYGFSPCHSRMKGFELICKGYLYDHENIRSWSCKKENRYIVDERMTQLQKGMKDEFNLEVFKVQASSVGNTNSGNTSRDAFSNPEKFAKIVGWPVDLIADLGLILDLANSKDEIDTKGFGELCTSWRDRYKASRFSWNWLSPSGGILFRIIV